MQQHERTAAQSQSHRVVWVKHDGLFSELMSFDSIRVRRCAEVMRGALAPAPCCDGLRQRVRWRQFLRLIKSLEGFAALLWGNGERQRQSAHCQASSLVEVQILMPRMSRSLDRRRRVFTKTFPIGARKTA